MLARDQLGNCRGFSGSSLARLSRESPQKKVAFAFPELDRHHAPCSVFKTRPPRPRRDAFFHRTMHKKKAGNAASVSRLGAKQVYYLYMQMLPLWDGVCHGESFHTIKNRYFNSSAVLDFSKIDTSPKRGA